MILLRDVVTRHRMLSIILMAQILAVSALVIKTGRDVELEKAETEKEVRVNVLDML